MEEKKREVELNIKDLGTVFLRCWWIMLLVGVLVGAGAYLILSLVHTDRYTATASIYVMREAVAKTSGADAIQTQSGDVSISNNLKADVMKLPLTRKVLTPVMQKVGIETTESNYTMMKSAIKTSSEDNEHIVYFSVTADDRQSAVTLANLLVEETCTLFNDELFENERYVKELDAAVEPENPSNPISKVLILLVTVGAMVIVYLIFFVLFMADDKINDAEDVQNYLGVSLLGQIPNRRETGRRKKKYGGYYAYESHGDKKATSETAKESKNDQKKGDATK